MTLKVHFFVTVDVRPLLVSSRRAHGEHSKLWQKRFFSQCSFISFWVKELVADHPGSVITKARFYVRGPNRPRVAVTKLYFSVFHPLFTPLLSTHCSLFYSMGSLRNTLSPGEREVLSHLGIWVSSPY